MKTKLLLLVACLASTLHSQISIEWSSSIKEGYAEFARHFIQTSDNGYLVFGQDLSEENPSGDYLVKKVSSNGELEWTQTYGGTNVDEIHGAQEGLDGNYYIFGNTNSSDGDITTNQAGDEDCWLLKINPDGDILWSKTLGGIMADCGFDILVDQNGEITVLSFTRSSQSGDVSTINTDQQLWLAKLDVEGNVIWDNSYGTTEDNDTPIDMKKTNDGGYIILARASYIDFDTYLLKVNSSGIVEWNHWLNYDNSQMNLMEVSVLTDGGYIVSGQKLIDFQGIPFRNKGLLRKISTDGELVWEKSFGGQSHYDHFKQTIETQDGNLLSVGTKATFNNTDPTNNNYAMAWVHLTNNEGELIWEATLSHNRIQHGIGIIQNDQDHFTLLAHSEWIHNPYFSEDHHNNTWLVQFTTAPVSTKTPLLESALSLSPNPATDEVFVQSKDFLLQRIEVYDSRGRLLLTQNDKANTSIINVGHLSAGHYILKAYAEQGISTQKLIIK